MKNILPRDIVAFASFSDLYPIKVDAVYAKPDHPENAFGQIYHPDAQLWGHRHLVKVVLLAAKRLHDDLGWVLTIKDCLRPIEAQALMIETPIVKANPHWLQEPRFLSSPGQGGHPRGMAVDVAVEGIDFGTGFDHFSASSDKDHNPAHRDYTQSTDSVRRNREVLEKALISAAEDFRLPMLPLPQEWWDFRFPHAYTKDFAPLSDNDLLPHQKVVAKAEQYDTMPDDEILEALAKFTGAI